MVEIKGLTKSFQQAQGQRLVVLDGLSLALQEGEQVAIVGESGSGKSTLLHLIAGLDKADAGEVFIDRSPILSMPPSEQARWRRKNLGIIFQFYHLLPELNLLENVMLPLMLLNYPDEQARDMTLELLGRFGLKKRAYDSVYGLSGGEMQRVAILRAVVHRPRIILADEPTGNLDLSMQDKVMRFLIDLCREMRITLITVTHSRHIAGMFERVFVLERGRLGEGLL